MDQVVEKNGAEKPVGWNEVVEASTEVQRKAGERPARIFGEILPCLLTEADLALIARETGKLRSERREIENKARMSKEHWKAKLDGVDAHLDELGEKAEKGTESREVKCREDFLYETGTVRVTRLDTGEVIRERAMSAAERQPNLPGVSAGSVAEQTTFADVEPQDEDDDSSEDEEALASGDLKDQLDAAFEGEGAITDPDALIADAEKSPDFEPEAPKKRGRKAQA